MSIIKNVIGFIIGLFALIGVVLSTVCLHPIGITVGAVLIGMLNESLLLGVLAILGIPCLGLIGMFLGLITAVIADKLLEW